LNAKERVESVPILIVEVGGHWTRYWMHKGKETKGSWKNYEDENWRSVFSGSAWLFAEGVVLGLPLPTHPSFNHPS
jgi:hypothetical protein